MPQPQSRPTEKSATHERARVGVQIDFDTALDAVADIINRTEYPTLLAPSTPERLEQLARLLRERVSAHQKAPRKCGSCGAYIHECECN